MLSDNLQTDFGTIVFVRSERAKHLSARIQLNGLRVTLPRGATEQEALNFLNTRRTTILRKQQHLHTKHENHQLNLQYGNEINTLSFNIQIIETARNDLFFSLKDGILRIEFPQNANLNTVKAQKNCWNGINYFLRKEAKRLLPSRLKQLADQHGFQYSEVKIQSSKSRWGSCSRARSINLSFYLMLLPAHLVDYVLLHELCHTKEMNHSDKFWAWMDHVTDSKSKELRAALKHYNMPT
ncbi:MAG: hypothetical protein AUK44_09445 [Porphyromonadaceae bacterium CG2_30_38_12]|nr:MAG: hypothetical protein AUK44_09445 [Porphyromonadaceae bacterium CG2_30_38_12]